MIRARPPEYMHEELQDHAMIELEQARRHTKPI